MRFGCGSKPMASFTFASRKACARLAIIPWPKISTRWWQFPNSLAKSELRARADCSRSAANGNCRFARAGSRGSSTKSRASRPRRSTTWSARPKANSRTRSSRIRICLTRKTFPESGFNISRSPSRINGRQIIRHSISQNNCANHPMAAANADFSF